VRFLESHAELHDSFDLVSRICDWVLVLTVASLGDGWPGHWCGTRATSTAIMIEARSCFMEVGLIRIIVKDLQPFSTPFSSPANSPIQVPGTRNWSQFCSKLQSLIAIVHCMQPRTPCTSSTSVQLRSLSTVFSLLCDSQCRYAAKAFSRQSPLWWTSCTSPPLPTDPRKEKFLQVWY
jgi:hypothetical protein